jgi:hypothetical protein
MLKEILVKKADGSTEPFMVSKLEHSLKSAGASEDVKKEIVETIINELFDGISTKKIYRSAFNLLREKEKKPIAAKYSLKAAIFNLGPSGFPFEDFIAEVYRSMGYKTKTGVILEGVCAEHEVDLFATYNGKKYGAEIKFHNHQGVKTDLKVALYVYARFDDLKKSNEVDQGILITNTKFTKSALSYGKCVGLKMIGWDSPKEENLYSLIEDSGLHPITCLSTLSSQDKKRLIENKVLLCRTIIENASILETNGVSTQRIPNVLEEARVLCQPGTGV